MSRGAFNEPTFFCVTSMPFSVFLETRLSAQPLGRLSRNLAGGSAATLAESLRLSEYGSHYWWREA
jgi:hypothetical protein